MSRIIPVTIVLAKQRYFLGKTLKFEVLSGALPEGT